MKRFTSICLRDPCVLAHGGLYYVYGTGASQGAGYGCYVSRDLVDWTGPCQVFTPPAGHSGTGNWWAPECHAYQGKFYLFATYMSSETGHRGVSVFRADDPLGPFEEISNGHATPHDWDAIDGTLYVDAQGQPWMVFVHEWTSMPDGMGDFSAARMSEDLTALTDAPIPLFKASALPFRRENKVTDGCWLYRSKTGRLLMLWSGFGVGGYCVAQAVSLSGEIAGPWVQNPTLLYRKNSALPHDGGHGALFTGPGGALMLGLHSPQSLAQGEHEIPTFFEVLDKGASLTLKENSAPWLRGIGAALWDAVVWVMRGVHTLFC